MKNIIEIETVNLPRELKPFKDDERFVAWLPGEPVSEPTSYQDAVRTAIALGDRGCVGFLVDEPAPAVPAPVALNYSKPLPGILSKKRK